MEGGNAMSEAFDFDIEKSWRAVGSVLGAAVSEKFIKRWRSAKEPYLSVLGKTGRVEEKVYLNVEHAAVMDAFFSLHNAFAGTYVARALSYYYSSYPIEWLADNTLKAAVPDPRPGKEGKLLPAGTKVTRYLEMLALSYYDGTQECRRVVFSVQLSQAIARLKPSQYTIVLSVNPLDMLLVSEHTAGGWRSCHALDGEYCAGTLSYMLDGVTAVAYAYRTTDKHEKTGLVLPRKVWRQMVYFDLDGMSALLSRQYPGDDQRLEKETRRLAAKLLSDYHGAPQKWLFRTLYAANDADTDTASLNAYSLGKCSNWHYRDTPTSWVRLAGGRPPAVVAGTSVMLCPACGAARYPRDGDVDIERQFLLCADCAGDPVCADCGVRCSTDGAYTGADGSDYCQNCFHDRFAYCERCGDVIEESDAFRADGDWYCEDCYSTRYADCCICGNAIRRGTETLDDDGDAYCDRCRDRYLSYCAGCGSYHGNDAGCPACTQEDEEEMECA
jgi:hypothetical protein